MHPRRPAATALHPSVGVGLRFTVGSSFGRLLGVAALLVAAGCNDVVGGTRDIEEDCQFGCEVSQDDDSSVQQGSGSGNGGAGSGASDPGSSTASTSDATTSAGTGGAGGGGGDGGGGDGGGDGGAGGSGGSGAGGGNGGSGGGGA